MESVERCKNCKHWSKAHYYWGREGWGKCEHPLMGLEANDKGYGDIPSNGIDAVEGEFGLNVFSSGPEFGCVNWEDKDAWRKE